MSNVAHAWPAHVDDEGGTGGDSTRPAAKVGVIVSDPAASARWEHADEPLLHDAMGAEGLDADVQNSEGNATKFATIADAMINNGLVQRRISPSGVLVSLVERAQPAEVEAPRRRVGGR